MDISSLTKDWYKPGEVAKLLEVTPRTINNYIYDGRLEARIDTVTNRNYISRENVIKLLETKGVVCEKKSVKVSAIYARVSSHDQKKNGDLDRQISRLESYCRCNNIFEYEVYFDVASGLNSNRASLNSLMDAIMAGKIDKVYITHKDRLTRFGFEYLEKFFKHFGVYIVIVDIIDEKLVQEELVEDMMSLLASFSGRLCGMRSGAKKKAKTYIDEIPDEV